MTVLDILRSARSRIDTPEKWWSPSKRGGGTCALVAFDRTWDRKERGLALDALSRAMGVSASWKIPQFNNSHEHAEVLAAFDEAIANEEARAQEFIAEPIRAPEVVHA